MAIRVYVIAESTASNSLGRAISLALTAEPIGAAELWALDTGPVWVGAAQFGVPVNVFSRNTLPDLAHRIEVASQSAPTIVWISKGAKPLDDLGVRLSSAPGVTLVADFDDDDFSLMRETAARSLKSRVRLNWFARKSPRQIKKAQRRLDGAAGLTTFSSDALRLRMNRRGIGLANSAIVAHTRVRCVRSPEPLVEGPLTLGFFGTIRAHKGIDDIVSLLDAMPDTYISYFEQDWQPPARQRDRWRSAKSDAPLADLYAGISCLLVPQNPASAAAQVQLPAKIIDAANAGKAVVATPTDPIREYAGTAFVAIDDWTDLDAVSAAIRSADLPTLGLELHQIFTEKFSQEATSAALREGLGRLERPGH
jgi:glycosyltransferase involved in cell wall biosynthesis